MRSTRRRGTYSGIGETAWAGGSVSRCSLSVPQRFAGRMWRATTAASRSLRILAEATVQDQIARSTRHSRARRPARLVAALGVGLALLAVVPGSWGAVHG